MRRIGDDGRLGSGFFLGLLTTSLFTGEVGESGCSMMGWSISPFFFDRSSGLFTKGSLLSVDALDDFDLTDSGGSLS